MINHEKRRSFIIMLQHNSLIVLGKVTIVMSLLFVCSIMQRFTSKTTCSSIITQQIGALSMLGMTVIQKQH